MNQTTEVECCHLTFKVLFTGVTTVGKGSGVSIVLHGPGIVAQHAELRNKDGDVTLLPLNGSILHNGKELTKSVLLCHADRYLIVIFSPTNCLPGWCC